MKMSENSDYLKIKIFFSKKSIDKMVGVRYYDINKTKEETTSKTGGQSNEITISHSDNKIEREVIQ